MALISIFSVSPNWESYLMAVRLCHLVSNHYGQPERSLSLALNNVPSQVLRQNYLELIPTSPASLDSGQSLHLRRVRPRRWRSDRLISTRPHKEPLRYSLMRVLPMSKEARDVTSLARPGWRDSRARPLPRFEAG